MNVARNIVFIAFIAFIVAIIGLVGCNSDEQTNNGASFAVTTNTVQESTEEKPEPTPEPKKQNYYTDLVENDAQQKEEANQKKAEDFELAEKMLRICTQKLQNCTININATAEFKCSDENTQTISVGDVPTNGKYETTTVVQITPNASQLSCKQIKTLYRDITALSTEAVLLIAQTVAEDTWTDNMQFNLYIERPNDNYTNTVTEHLNKGTAYKYLSRDVRSCLNNILAINIFHNKYFRSNIVNNSNIFSE